MRTKLCLFLLKLSLARLNSMRLAILIVSVYVTPYLSRLVSDITKNRYREQNYYALCNIWREYKKSLKLYQSVFGVFIDITCDEVQSYAEIS